MPPLSDDPDHDAALDAALMETSLEAARVAAGFHRVMQGSLGPGEAIDKSTANFVTTVDHESARLIVDLVRDRFPHHIIMAEDDLSPVSTQSETGAGERMLWVIDPLDGTTNWLHGYASFGVSIATVDSRGLRTGVVINSSNEEEFTAQRGGGAMRDGHPIRVSEVSDPKLALLGTGFPFKRRELLPRYLAVLGTMLAKTSGVRRQGAASVDLCDVACGRLDAFWEHWLRPWDVAAGALIVREAGGTFGPLPSTIDPVLQRAVEGGHDVVRAFAGERRLTLECGGAFLAGNGRIEPGMRELWSGGAVEGLARGNGQAAPAADLWEAP
ncbi:inositol monophosphatase family protein [Candidatus Palauibacter sp.]|uniref:inositol monophosphatase family protein n=1 Tax=Candidatus Palauibacter sp. TaxID=3101350 RepID=UPI003AF21FD4